MDQELLARLIATAAQDVFSTMLNHDVSVRDPRFEDVSPAPTEGVVALIGVAGPWVGTGLISCSAPLACKLASSMLMTECRGVDSEVLDVIAELANMIFGNVKTELEEHLGPLGLSIPTVIFGRNFATRSIGHQAWTVVPLSVGAEDMDLKMCLTKNPDSAAKSGSNRVYALQA